MKRLWWLWLGLAMTLVLGGLIGAAWLFTPQVTALSPADGSAGIDPRSPLEVRFSQPMRAESSTLPVAELLSFDPTVDGEVIVAGDRLTFIPARPWPGGVVITATLQGGLRAAAWPGLAVSGSRRWQFSAAQTLLAYLWPANEQADLYALDPAGGDVRQYTSGGGVRDYEFSSDGRWILYSLDRGDGSALLRLDRRRLAQSDGQILEPEMLLDCGADFCRSPRLSPDGRRLAFERAPIDSGLVSVWLLDLQSGEQRLAAAENQASHSPVWSAQGWLAVYNVHLSAYQLYPPDGSQALPVNAQAGEPGVWNPDGSAFLFPDVVEERFNLLEITSSGRLLQVNLQAGALTAPLDLTRQNDLEDMAPAFSPDGGWIAFARKQVGAPGWSQGRQLWLMRSDGAEARSLTADLAYNYYDFAWRADSAQIAFVRSNQNALADPPELWLVNADGSELVQLVIGAFSPQWAP